MQQPLDFMELIPLSGIRAALARRDAMLILSQNLNMTLWANDAGAQLIGERDAATAIGQDTQLSPQTKRQILALDLSAAKPQNLMLRLAGALHSALLQCTITPLKLEETHQHAILICAPAASDALTLTLPHHHAVWLDAEGQPVQADASFCALNINNNTLSDLVVEVRDEADGIVKRRVRAGNGTLASMLFKLDDGNAEASYLFIVSLKDKELEEKEPAVPVKAATLQETVETTAPVRFIWKVDAQTRFIEISSEFSAAVGTNAADIIGRKFSDVARVFGFDHDGSVSALMNQRDTWSGKRIFWPVEGTNKRIPVELAALPAFTRNKEFSGFSGFGVLYPALAETDPEAIGMALVASPILTPAPIPAQAQAQAQDDNAELAAARASEKIILMEALRASQKRYEPSESPDGSAPPQETAVEKSNIIAEIRPARSENGLSPTERNAFREIADRLRREVMQKTPEARANAHTEELPLHASSEPSAAPVEAEIDDADIPYPHDVTPANLNQNTDKPKLVAVQGGIRQQDEDDLHMLSGLPVPVLIHCADRLHFANQAFFDMTGYGSLDDLRHAGGIDALFAPSVDSDISGMILCLADGGHKIVEAHLQSVPWQGARALMLSLLPELALKADNDDSLGHRTLTKPALVAVAAKDNPVRQLQAELALQSVQIPASDEASAADLPQQDVNTLQTQIDELTSILDTATDGVVIIGQDGKIRSLNQSASALFGYDSGALSGKSFAVLFAIESQRAAIDYIHGLSGDGVASLLNDGREVIGREAQGRFIPLFMTIGKLPASKGYCAVMRDITQWKRAEEELTTARQEAERASTHKTEFLARISHEIRTPLNAIIGFSELMAEEKFGPVGNDRYREYLRDIHRSGNHVLALVNDLLDISKIEAGALDLDFEAVALNDALAEAVAMMQPQANRERVIIRSSFSAFLPDIVADARSIRQVALNLLSNAIRFTGQGGQVIVSTSYEADGQVVMRVRDTGIGMNQSELEQALKPFKQVSNHNSQTQTLRNPDVKDWRSQGTGLGLPLTKAMVEANRAQFTIESAPDQGTTVEVCFPSTRVLAE